MKLVLIPSGEFQMGSPEDEKGPEKPFGIHPEVRHRVRITRAFYMGAFHVTQEEYRQIMGVNLSKYSAGGTSGKFVQGMDTRRFPVDSLCWYDAEEFCRRMSERENKKYRLPTEAEWEYACRAGTTTPFNFGEVCDGSQANCDARTAYGTTVKGLNLDRPTVVGSYKPNAFGLYDMHGNIHQWCSDWFAGGYYARSPVDDPPGIRAADLNPNSPSVQQGTVPRVARGGAFYDDPVRCRSAARYSFEPYRYAAGFRVVCEMPER